MLYNKKLITTFIFIVIIFLFANSCLASVRSDVINQTGEVTDGAGYAQRYAVTYLPEIIAEIIKVFLGLLGIIFLVLIIYAGYNWMTAQGEEEKVTKAKDTLQRAVIGLIIIIAAYSITYFVFRSLSEVGTGGAQTGPIK